MFYPTVLCFCVLIVQISSSAIPMWEYLSKQEKMSYLYSMFANQVEDFCDSSKMKNCNHELLKYGLNKMKDMSEDHLDVMDPYQRGANNIIWDAMMDGHEMMSTTPNPHKIVTTTAKPNSYDDQSFADFGLGSEEAGSARIETVYRVPPPKGFVFKIETGKPLYTYPNQFHHVPIDVKTRPYNRFQQFYTTNAPEQKYLNSPLTGPMVVKVYPDGTPVRGLRQPLPYDEDLRQYQLSKVRLPEF